MPELANGLAWKARVVKHICDRDAVAPPSDGVIGVAATRQFVTLEFWVRPPNDSPISIWMSSSVARAIPSHGMRREFDSLLIYQFDSDWRSWLARLLDMEKVVGSNPTSETTLLWA